MTAGSKLVGRGAVGLLAVHALLLALSIPRNAVTIDEVVHLPTGIAYWHRGEFWGYHHNPPLVRLLFAVPAVALDVPIDYSGYYYRLHSRAADCELGRDFMLLNRGHYMLVYSLARGVTAALSVLGGWLVFRWSRELFGDAGGLLSLSLWVFCPNVLAHAGLVTPDVGATVVGFFATHQFWRYLQSPSSMRAAWCGVLLGLAQAAKFSSVVLPAVWVVAAAVHFARREHRIGWGRVLGHAGIVLCFSLVALNDVYLGEGTGRRLGEFEFRSRALTREVAAEDGRIGNPSHARRENRFRGTALENVPMPFPKHYLLGFDDQMWDVDTGMFYKYLRGDLRRGPGWWYYYLYCLLVKTPVGTLLAVGAAFLLLGLRRCRSDLVSEALLLLPIVTFLAATSSQTGLNSHLRYVLPAYPFLFVFAGRLGRLAEPRLIGWVLLALLVALNAASVLQVHPHYLAYFNEPAGGPRHGHRHLADSNIDWGQGLVALRDWLREHAPDRELKLAYFGTMYPEVLDIEYELPPYGPEAARNRDDAAEIGPVPGLQAVSVNYLLGIPFPAPNGQGEQRPVPLHAYSYSRRFEPVATPGWSIYVYHLEIDEVNRVRREMGLPEL